MREIAFPAAGSGFFSISGVENAMKGVTSLECGSVLRGLQYHRYAAWICTWEGDNHCLRRIPIIMKHIIRILILVAISVPLYSHASPESSLDKLGIELPEVSPAIANYVSVVRTGDLLFLSGHLLTLFGFLRFLLLRFWYTWSLALGLFVVPLIL